MLQEQIHGLAEAADIPPQCVYSASQSAVQTALAGGQHQHCLALHMR